MKRIRSLILGIFIVTCFLTVFFLTQCRTSAKEEFFLNLNDSVQYVGMHKCRVCHEDKYNTFIETGMGRSFGLATKEKSAGIFSSQASVYDPKLNLYYYPFWENNSMKILEFRIENGDTTHKRVETIKYIVGSGHHTNSHFWEDNGYLFQAPITFYTQLQKWDLPPGFEVTNTRFGRKIDIECMSCHNAMPVVEENAVNKFSKLSLGIDCERCHGPGELHVAEKERGHLTDTKKEADRTIVNPSRLPWKLQVDVCQRCHLQGNNVLKPGKKFSDFRPGMALNQVFEVYMPEYENPEYFVMAGHSERFQMSECFVKSNPKSIESFDPKLNFTCITCHDPHVSVSKTNIEKFNNTCKNCHNEAGKSKLKKCGVDRQILLDNLNNCVKCHMPSVGTADIPHVRVHDHYIRKPKSKDNISETGKLLGLYAVNNPNPSEFDQLKAYISWYEKFSSEALYAAKAKTLLKKVKDNTLEIHFAYNSKDYETIKKLSTGLDHVTVDAWTNYRVAKALDKLGELENSLGWYKNAYESMALNIDFGAEYANALIRSKKIQTAEILLQKLYKEQTKNEFVLVNLAAAKFLQQNYSVAKQYLNAALALNPDNLTALLYMVDLYTKVNDTAKAKIYMKKAKKMDPKVLD